MRALLVLLALSALCAHSNSHADTYRCGKGNYRGTPAPGCVLLDDRVSTVPAHPAWREKQPPREEKEEPAQPDPEDGWTKDFKERQRELRRDRDPRRHIE